MAKDPLLDIPPEGAKFISPEEQKRMESRSALPELTFDDELPPLKFDDDLPELSFDDAPADGKKPSIEINAPKIIADEIGKTVLDRGLGLGGASSLVARGLANNPKAPEFTDNMIESFKRGNTSSDIAMLKYSSLLGQTDYFKDVKPASDAFRKRVSEDPIKGENLLSNAAYSVSGMLPAMGKGIIEGKETAMVAALGTAAIPGAQPLIPAAFAAGDTAGAFNYWYKQGSGDLYGDLKDEGVDDTIAKPVAHLAGGLYGAIEFSQVGKLIPGAKETTRRFVTGTVKKAVQGLIKKYGQTWAEEVGEEGLQEIVVQSAKDIATNLAGKTQYGVGSLVNRALTSFVSAVKESAVPMALLLTPSAGVDIAREVKPKENLPPLEDFEPKTEVKPDVEPGQAIQQIATDEDFAAAVAGAEKEVSEEPVKTEAVLDAEKVGKVVGIDAETKLPIIDTSDVSRETKIIEDLGGTKVAPFVQGKTGPNDLIQFNIEEGTLAIKRKDITPESIAQKIAKKKEQFATKPSEAPKKEEEPKVEKPRKKRVYNEQKAAERGDRATLIKAFGGWSDKPGKATGAQAKADNAKLLQYRRKGAQGIDELLDELKGQYPALFDQYATGEDLRSAILSGNINDGKVSNDNEKELERQLAEYEAEQERIHAESLKIDSVEPPSEEGIRQAEADIESEQEDGDVSFDTSDLEKQAEDLTPLEKANQARQDKALDKTYQFSHGASTFREAIKEGRFVRAEKEDVPVIEYDRRKFNRMDAKEQKAYEEKLNERKTEYRLYRPDDSFNVVPKMVFDYFNSNKPSDFSLESEKAPEKKAEEQSLIRGTEKPTYRKPVFGEARAIPDQKKDATDLQKSKNDEDQDVLFEPGADYSGRRFADVTAEDFELKPEKMKQFGLVKLAIRDGAKVYSAPYGKDGIFNHMDVIDKYELPYGSRDMVNGFLDVRGRFVEQGMDSRFSEPEATYNVSNLGFYSAVEKTVLEKMPNSASPTQIMGLLRNAPGVKQEELDWIGIEEFLEGKTKVSKDELKAFLKESQVEIQEVTKGGLGAQNEDQFQEFKTEMENKYEASSPFVFRSMTPQENERWKFLSEKRGVVGETKFQNYTIPGGENYREVLLTMPDREAEKKAKQIDSEHERDYANFVDGLRERLNSPGLNPYDAYDTNLMTRGERAQWDSLVGRLGDLPRTDYFKSGHWDEKNILAHVRLNDRQTDLGKTLFVEEVQSDWAQKGRKEGYKGAEAERRIKEIGDELEVIYKSPEFRNMAYPKSDEIDRKTTALKSERDRLKFTSVPNMPFKKTWHELAMKRALKMAVEEGYDAVAWTTGEQQADRYDLSKQISMIQWSKLPDGDYAITANGLRGGDIEGMRNKRVKESELADNIGKELAQKITTSTEKSGKFTGLDLKVGGEGMKGFYDQMLPQFLNKFTKKWGGRVQDISMTATQEADIMNGEEAETDTTQVHALEITPSMKSSIEREGMALFDRGFDEVYASKQKELDLTYGSKEKAKEAAQEVKEIADRFALTNLRRADAVRQKVIPRIDFRGQNISTPEKMAGLFQVFRLPSAEHFHYAILNDKGDIIAHHAITSGFVDQVVLSNELFFEIRAEMKALGGTKLAIMHNHPSGTMRPSPEDQRLTLKFAERFPTEFQYHVVLDHGEFVHIDKHGQSEVGSYEYNGKGNWLKETLGKVRDHTDFAAFSADVLRAPDYIHIAFLDQGNNVVAYNAFNPKMDYFRLAKKITALRGAYASTRYVLLSDPNTLAKVDNLARTKMGISENYFPAGLMDIIAVRPDGTHMSYRDEGRDLESDNGGSPYGSYMVVFDKEQDYGKAPSGFASSKESTGERTPDDNPAKLPEGFGGQQFIKRLKSPELYRLAVEISGNVPQIKKKLRGAYGRFYGKGQGEIKLDASMFKNQDFAASVLAHKIGHNIDWLEEGNLSRGNLVGRAISSVTQYTARTFAKDMIGAGKLDLAKLRNKTLMSYLKSNGIKFKEWIKEKDTREKHKSAFKVAYDKAVIDAIKYGGYLDNQIFKKELRDLTQFWKPFDEASAESSYVKYRYKPEELYADFISVILNAPAKAEEIAPNFYKAFFENLDAKPNVKKVFFHIQNQVLGDPYLLGEQRQQDIEGMFAKGEDQFRANQVQAEAAKQSFLSQMQSYFFDRGATILSKRNQIDKIEPLNPNEDPKYILGQMRRLTPVVKSYLDEFDLIWKKIKSGGEELHNAVSAIMFLDRVGGDRAELANSKGFTPETAKEQLSHLEKHRPEIYAQARALVSDVRVWFKQIGDLMAQDILTEDQKRVLNENQTYAPFRVIKYMSDYVSAGFMQQIGTFEDVGDPLTAMVMKSVSMIKSAKTNEAKKKIANFMLKNQAVFGTVIEDKVGRDEKGAPVYPRAPKQWLESIVWREGGKYRIIHVEKQYAEALQTNNDNAFWMLGLVGSLGSAKVFRPLYISLNVGFQYMAFPIDFWRAWINTPNTSFLKLLKNYSRSISPAMDRAKGRFNPLINEMEREGALTVTLQQMTLGEKTEDRELDALMKRYNLDDKKTMNRFYKPFITLLDALQFSGNLFETLHKVAGYQGMEGLPQVERVDKTVNLIGTPSVSRSGQAYQATNQIFMFSEMFKEGLRGDVDVLRDPKQGGTAIRRRLFLAVMPAVLAFAIRQGLLGDDEKEKRKNITEYDETNYMCVPIGVFNGKTAYIRIPLDQTSRMIHGLVYKVLQSSVGEGKDFRDVLDFTAQQVPSVAPMVELIDKWITYGTGNMPRDSFRQRDILTRDQLAAGGWESLEPMLKWTMNQTGWFRFSLQDRLSDQTMVEKAIQAVPIINRFIRYTDYGKTEDYRNASKVERKEEAKQRIAYSDELLEMAREGAPARSKKEKKKLQKIYAKASDDPAIRSISGLTSNREKAAVLRRRMEDFEGYSDYRQYVVDNAEKGVLSLPLAKLTLSEAKKKFKDQV